MAAASAWHQRISRLGILFLHHHGINAALASAIMHQSEIVKINAAWHGAA